MKFRKFLTDLDADSYIKVMTWNDSFGSKGGNAEVKIADCDRNVKLGFNHYNKRAALKSLKKINILIDSLTKLKVHLESKLANFE